ncbi:MAG: GlsB/YeaQ/YmgE family stress response membrane protein [Alphaproteobacteria bacterium]|nr:GlsB/YeaQ/YmgE family stress response membrane protein [Alphaproteobacteria bacterium]
MGFIIAIVMGLIVGVVAKAIVPGRDPGGIFVTILIGIGGGFVGGLIARQTGFYGGGFGIGNFLFSVLGAVILLVGWRMLKNSQRS